MLINVGAPDDSKRWLEIGLCIILKEKCIFRQMTKHNGKGLWICRMANYEKADTYGGTNGR